MNDPIYQDFLDRQLVEGLAFARSSAIVELLPIGRPGMPPNIYWAELRCRGLVRMPEGVIAEASAFTVSIYFSPNYLRRINPLEVVTVLDPPNVFHPNVRGSTLCPGSLPPGTSLVDVLHQVHEILTYTKVTVAENNALNRDACAWARSNMARFPIDARPLGRRLALSLERAVAAFDGGLRPERGAS